MKVADDFSHRGTLGTESVKTRGIHLRAFALRQKKHVPPCEKYNVLPF